MHGELARTSTLLVPDLVFATLLINGPSDVHNDQIFGGQMDPLICELTKSLSEGPRHRVHSAIDPACATQVGKVSQGSLVDYIDTYPLKEGSDEQHPCHLRITLDDP